MAEGEATSKASEVPKVVAGLMALVALASSIFSGNDPWTTLTRGAVAFVAGYIVATLWFALTGRQIITEQPQLAEEPQAEEQPSDEATVPLPEEPPAKAAEVEPVPEPTPEQTAA